MNVPASVIRRIRMFCHFAGNRNYQRRYAHIAKISFEVESKLLEFAGIERRLDELSERLAR